MIGYKNNPNDEISYGIGVSFANTMKEAAKNIRDLALSGQEADEYYDTWLVPGKKIKDMLRPDGTLDKDTAFEPMVRYVESFL